MKRFLFWTGVVVVGVFGALVLFRMWDEHQKQKVAMLIRQEADAVRLALKETQAMLESKPQEVLFEPGQKLLPASTEANKRRT